MHLPPSAPPGARLAVDATAPVSPEVRLARADGVTLAVAVLTADGGAVAADGQEVTATFEPGQPYTVRHVVKVTSGPAGVGVVSGFTATPAGRLVDALAAALDATSLPDAARAFLGAAGEAIGPYAGRLAELVPVGDVVWESVLLGRSPDGGAAGLLLTGWNDRRTVALDVRALPDAPRPLAVAIGARHPALRRYDYRYHARYPQAVLAAELTRSPVPAAPWDVPSDQPAGHVAASLLRVAIESADLADRPATWPTDLPVAAAPVSVCTLR